MTWRVLDLFSGTDSVKKACVGLSFFGEVISLDLAKADGPIPFLSTTSPPPLLQQSLLPQPRTPRSLRTKRTLG